MAVQLAGSPQSYIANGSGCQQDSAFEHDGNQYAILVSGGYPSGAEGDGKFHALKSTDGGATWTEMDAANAPAPDGEGALAIPGWRPAQSICRDGSTVYLVAAKYALAATNGVQTWTFNLSTDTWAAGITSSVIKPQYGLGLTEYTPALKLLRVAAGSLVCVFGASESGAWTGTDQRIYTATFDGSTFGTPTILPGESGAGYDFLFGDAFVDSGGYLTVFYHTGAAIPQSNLYAMTRNPSGSWGTEKTLDSTTNFNLIPHNASNQAYGGVGQFGSNIGLVIAYSGATDSCNFYWGNAGTNNPTWHKAVVADHLTDILTFFAKPGKAYALAIGSDGNLYAFWTLNDNGQDPPFHGRWQYAVAAQSDPGTWGAATDLFATTGDDDWGAYGTIVWLMTGAVGVLGISANGNIDSADYDGVLTDFDFVNLAPVVVVFNEFD